MAQDKTLHTKHLGENRYRDLNVSYEKGGMNHWTGKPKPKGIYFSSSTYTKSISGAFVTRSYTIGSKGTGDGYVLATALERYKPTALKAVRSLVEDHADLIHRMIEVKDGHNLTSLLTGEMSDDAIRGLGHAYAPIAAQDNAAA